MILELILITSLLFGIEQNWDKMNIYSKIFFILSVIVLYGMSLTSAIILL